MNPQPENQEPTADVVAEFLAAVRESYAEAGTTPPSFVANHQPGDRVLYSSPAQPIDEIEENRRGTIS